MKNNNMIYIIIGTRAQLVKMAPVIKNIEANKWPLTLIHTGQHKESIDKICQNFQIETKWHLLYKHQDEVKTIFHAIRWLFKLATLIVINPYSLLPNYNKSTKNIIIVHGDTFSTVIGALLGKRTGIKVAHIESGLRSFHLFNPFPEEINRLITFRLIDIAFCPGQWATDNLSAYNVKKINTINNTLLDALKIATQSNSDLNYPIPDTEYAVVSIHRFENIFYTKQLAKIIDQLIQISQSYHLVFILHPATYKRLVKTDLMSKLENNNKIELRKRTGYFNFVKLLASSKFVVTDGGSNQEELFYLNIPTFLMRKTTERQEGLNKNVYLGKLSDTALMNFISQLSLNTDKNRNVLLFEDSPSELICQEINSLSRMGFATSS